MPNCFETRISQKMIYILFAASKVIIHAKNIITFFYKPGAKVGSEKPRSTCYEYSFI